MPITLVNPLDETVRQQRRAAPKLDSLAGKTVGLLDISKPGGSVFLDRMEALLSQSISQQDQEHFFSVLDQIKKNLE